VFQPAYWICLALLIGSDLLARYGPRIERYPWVAQATVFGICGTVILYAWVIDRVPQPFIYYRY